MKKKGMTLVELIVAIAVMTIIMSFVAVALQPVIQNYGAQKKLNESKDIANNTLALIKNEIRNAKGYVDIFVGRYADVIISSDGKRVFGIDLPASYFDDVEALTLNFEVTDTSVKVTIVVDGYKVSGTYAPYKPGVTRTENSGQADRGNMLYITREPEIETP